MSIQILTVEEAAQEYLAKGWPITLCRHKAPFYKDWQNRRFTPTDVESMFRRNRNLNVGVILGPASGLIDIEGDEEDSEEVFATLFNGCEIPATLIYRSRRGVHRLFAWNDRLAELGRASIRWGSLDIRLGCKAAQSLLPPSRTDSFTREWINDCEFYEAAALPEFVISRLLSV